MKNLDDRFQGVCFACGFEYDTFYLSSSERLCKKKDCLHVGWPQEQHKNLVTIFPDWKTQIDINALPFMASKSSFDIFARWAGKRGEFPGKNRYKKTEIQRKNILKQIFPYKKDTLAEEMGRLNCGNAICYRSTRLEIWLTYPNICSLGKKEHFI